MLQRLLKDPLVQQCRLRANVGDDENADGAAADLQVSQLTKQSVLKVSYYNLFF